MNSQGISKVLEGHEKYSICVSFSPDGKYLAVGDQNKKVIIWDGSNFTWLKTISDANNYIENVEFSPNSKYLAVLYAGGDLSLYDVDKLYYKEETHTNSQASINYNTNVPESTNNGTVNKFSYVETTYAIYKADSVYNKLLEEALTFIEYGDPQYINKDEYTRLRDAALNVLDLVIKDGNFNQNIELYKETVSIQAELMIMLSDDQLEMIIDEVNKLKTAPESELTEVIMSFFLKDYNKDPMGIVKIKCSVPLKAQYDMLMEKYSQNILRISYVMSLLEKQLQ